MKKIQLYDRKPYSDFLRLTGIAIEKFTSYCDLTVSKHGHDIIEMNYVSKGCALQKLENVSLEFPAGTLSMVNCDQSHNLITPYEPVDIVNIYIDMQQIELPLLPEKFKPVLREMLPLHPMLGHNLNRMLHLKIEERQQFELVLNGMLFEQQNFGVGYAQAIKSYINLFLILICRSAINSGIIRSKSDDVGNYSKFEGLLDYIDTNFSKHLTLEALAAKIGYNKYYLCREFKKITGKTVFQYLAQRRIEKAMYELRTREKKIVDVAFDCGFNDVSGFNRMFRQTIGCSPTKYRKDGGFVK